MTTCLGKSCSFGFPPSAFRKLPSIYVCSYFPFGFEGRMWNLIVSVPDHCLSFYFLCQEYQLRILNGMTLGDLNGKLTCFKWNGSSTVGYGIVHKDLRNKIECFKVSELVGHISDHCSIYFGFKCSYKTTDFKNDLHAFKLNFRLDSQNSF